MVGPSFSNSCMSPPNLNKLNQELDDIIDKHKKMEHKHKSRMYKLENKFCKLYIGCFVFNLIACIFSLSIGIIKGQAGSITCAMINFTVAMGSLKCYSNANNKRNEYFLEML